MILTSDSLKASMRMLTNAAGFRTQVRVKFFWVGVIEHEERAKFIGERETAKDRIDVKTIAYPMLRWPFHDFSDGAEFRHVASVSSIT